MQPLTRGPEADETKTRDSDHATPRPGVTVKAAAAPSSAFDLCADALGVRSSRPHHSRRRQSDTVQVQEMAVMQPIICCVRAQTAR